MSNQKYIRLQLSNKHMKPSRYVPLIVRPNELKETIARYINLGYTVKAITPEGVEILS